MKHILGVLALALLATACDDDGDDANVEPEEARVGLEMRATTTLSQINAAGRTAETGLIFTQVLLGAKEIEFETSDENAREDEDGEGDDDDIEFEGRYTVDLINGTSTPDFGLADILPGVYEEVEFELGRIIGDSASIYIEFDRPQDGGDPIRVEYSSQQDFEIEIEDDDGFRLDEGGENHVLILFDLDKLMASVDLSTATVDDDGVIRINGSSNSNIAAQIARNLHDAFDAGDDDDDDDEFDDDDDD